MSEFTYCSSCGQKNTYSEIEGRNRFHCRECNTIHYENPKPTATLICPKVRKDKAVFSFCLGVFV